MSNTNDDKIKKLQNAALLLINAIDKKLAEDAPEGIFRISASSSLIKTKMSEIESGKMDFDSLSQIERAALLKTVLRELQNQKVALLNDDVFKRLIQAKQQIQDSENKETAIAAYNQYIKNMLNDSSFVNQEISFHLLSMLNKISKIPATKMNSPNLSIVIAPNIFQVSFEKLTPGEQIKLAGDLNIVGADLIEQAGVLSRPSLHLESTHYQHIIDSPKQGRFHALSVSGEGLKDEFKNLKGDYLKSKILLSFKKELEKIESVEALERRVNEIKEKSPEYKVLTRGQGLMTLFFRLETSSAKAFDEMVLEQKRNIEVNNQVSSLGMN